MGRAANQSGNTAERKQKTVPFVCTHQQGIKQHMRCVTALGEERGVWVWVVGDSTCAVLGRSHNRHHRATGMAWNGMGWGFERERERERMKAN